VSSLRVAIEHKRTGTARNIRIICIYFKNFKHMTNMQAGCMADLMLWYL
jgi:hypothetical protein